MLHSQQTIDGDPDWGHAQMLLLAPPQSRTGEGTLLQRQSQWDNRQVGRKNAALIIVRAWIGRLKRSPASLSHLSREPCQAAMLRLTPPTSPAASP